jgi:hypothetical protein
MAFALLPKVAIPTVAAEFSPATCLLVWSARCAISAEKPDGRTRWKSEAKKLSHPVKIVEFHYETTVEALTAIRCVRAAQKGNPSVPGPKYFWKILKKIASPARRRRRQWDLTSE